jgi:hypothetical protein
VNPRQLATLEFVREQIAVCGISPTLRAIAERVGGSVTGAQWNVDALIAAGHLTRDERRQLALPGRADLRGVPTDHLAAELARRGVTLASLDARPRGAGGPKHFCAIESCGAGVKVGHLMCLPHWLRVPHWLRQRILRSNATRDQRGFEQAVTEARATIAAGERRRA